MREETITVDGQTFIFDAEGIQGTPPSELFVTSRLDVSATNTLGRGAVRIIERGDCQWVLRKYRRGGLIGKLFKKNYVFTGLNRTRMAREFRLLGQLREQGLPVPKPVAVRIKRVGLIYRGALITERLPAENTLAETLQHTCLDNERWSAIGRCIRAFHNNGVYHADLNANNIMLDAERVYLIDFDRGRVRVPGRGNWQQANLNRLRHSLEKFRRTKPLFHFSDSDWPSLVQGYGGESTD